MSLYCTVYLVMPVSADGLGIVFGCLTIKLMMKVTRDARTRVMKVSVSLLKVSCEP